MFGQMYPHGHDWAVITTRYEGRDPEYTIHLVVERIPGQLGDCVTLLRGPCEDPGIPALEQMLDILQSLAQKR